MSPNRISVLFCFLFLFFSCSQKSAEQKQAGHPLHAEIRAAKATAKSVLPDQATTVYSRFLLGQFRVGTGIRVDMLKVHPAELICQTSQLNNTNSLTYFILQVFEPSAKRESAFYPYHDAALSAFAGGLKPFTKGEYFKKVNPEFVNWCAEHLIPDPDAELIKNYTNTYIYREGFRHIFRMYAKGYWMLQKRGYQEQVGDFATELEATASPADFNVNRMIESKYAEDFSKLFSEEELKAPPYHLTPRQTVSFWLRRGHDESAQALWKALVKVLSTYDQQWYEEYERKMNG